MSRLGHAVLVILGALRVMPGVVVSGVRFGMERMRRECGDRVARNPLVWLILAMGAVTAVVVATWQHLFPPSGYACTRCVQRQPGTPRFMVHARGRDGRCEDRPFCGPCFAMKLRHDGATITPELQAALDEEAAKVGAAVGA